MPLRKKLLIACSIVITIGCVHKITTSPYYSEKAIEIPATQQFPGSATEGFDYLVTGDYLKSGIPVKIYKKGLRYLSGKSDLGRTGNNKGIPFDFTYIKAPNGIDVVAPNCLFCHAQAWGDTVIVGLGNSLSDFSMPQPATMMLSKMAMQLMANDAEKAAGANLIRAGATTSPYLVTESKGVNIADRLTAVLAAHRDPMSFVWRDTPALKIPESLIPTDVPAWWLLKKKNAMFYNGFGRGDFPRFLMAANLLTVTDTSEAAEVLPHFYDVLAYIYSIQPPIYPKPIQQDLANQGQVLFEKHCSKCHGTYGDTGKYPNLLIPTHIVKTDSALVQSNFSSPQFLDWFKKSWFRTGNRQADLVPFNGYIAPPLDGVWITAPYLHNGSVPNLATLLNSKARPTYWARDFDQPQYDYVNVGWKYTSSDKQYTRSTYNTTLKGYSNSGHTFGDKLTTMEREAVIEYLKTL